MAWTNPWTPNSPADSDLASTLGVVIRTLKLDVLQRLNYQHIFGVSQAVPGGDGEHRNIVCSAAGLAANQEAILISGWSLTGANVNALINIAGTWNTTGAALPAILVNMTDTLSPVGTKLFDLRVGGVSKFSVDKTGNVAFSGTLGLNLNIVKPVVAYAIAANDDVILANGTFNVTLPVPSTRQRQLIVKNVGTGTITVVPNAAELIDGAASFVISIQFQSVTLVSDGTNWSVV